MEKNRNCCELRNELRRGLEHRFDEFDVGDHHFDLFNQDIVESIAYYDVGSIDVDDDGREEKRSGDEDEDAHHDWERLERPVGAPSAAEANDDSKLKAAGDSKPRATQEGKSDRKSPRENNWRPHRALIQGLASQLHDYKTSYIDTANALLLPFSCSYPTPA